MSLPMLSKAWTVVRAPDWWAYKIPPLLAIAYAGIIRFDGSPRTWAIAGAVLAGIVLVAVYGYVLNDICDVEADRLGGRPNRMAAAGTAARVAGLLAPSSGAIAIGWSTGDAVILGLLALNLLLPTLYSVPPVRLKGRGLWGALADAGGVHAVPAALVVRAVTLDEVASGWPLALFVASAVGWSFLSGLRGIVVHQVADLQADRLARVSTLAAAVGVEGSRRLVLRWLLPAELACLAAFLGVVLPGAAAAAAVITLFVVLELTKLRKGWRLPLFEPPETSQERYVPIVNNEIYEFWLPFGLALHLAFLHPVLWLLLVAQLIVFLPNVRNRLGDAWATLVPPRSSAKDAGAGPGELEQRGDGGPRPAPDYQVIIGTTSWTVNGVNVFSANLARGLQSAGMPVHVLLTEEGTSLVRSRETALPRPPGVPFRSFPVDRTDGWGMHWGRMVRYLRESAPCIYIPNSDWRHSCVCPRLPDDVVVVGIVHSDDPLHYDHVRRLGIYWNAIVAVSSEVARRTAQACPSVADRIVTIPIGVRIPEVHRVREGSTGPLRLVYHGILKQHQKRVLDFPKIVQAALDLGVPVEMSIVGAGPDENALREAARPLVERGAIRFLGVASPDDTSALLGTQDVYLLASEFEGMPNALLEAMGHGCVPVVTRTTSGIPELIRDGQNGFLVPIGDAAAFAGCLHALWNDPERRRQMSENAFKSVREGGFHVDDMVRAYRQVFDRAWSEMRAGRFVRPQGLLSPPPAQVAGVSLLPVDLVHDEAGVGSFPSAEDAEDYRDQVLNPSGKSGFGERAWADARIGAAASRISLDGLRVLVSAPTWTCNGVNLWSEDLVRGLRKAGLDARLLLTEESTDLVRIDMPRLSRPSDIPFDELRVRGTDNWGARWGAMIRSLEEAAPCVYFPNYDWRHSCIVPALSDRVMVVGTLHDGQDLYAEHAARLGAYWNAVVATSREIARGVRKHLPQLEDRLAVVPHGFCIPDEFAPKLPAPDASAIVMIIHAGNTGEEEAGWVKAMAQALARFGKRFQIVLVDPPTSLRDAPVGLGVRVVERASRQQWLELCRESHFVVAGGARDEIWRMTIEAMGHGCVPVLIGSGSMVERLLCSDDCAVVVPAGGWDAAAGRIGELASDPQGRMRMADRAGRAAREYGFSVEEMIDTYLDLFRRLMAMSAAGTFRRTRGPILPPPAEVGGTSILGVELRHRTRLGRFASRGDASRFCEESGMDRGIFGWRRS